MCSDGLWGDHCCHGHQRGPAGGSASAAPCAPQQTCTSRVRLQAPLDLQQCILILGYKQKRGSCSLTASLQVLSDVGGDIAVYSESCRGPLLWPPLHLHQHGLSISFAGGAYCGSSPFIGFMMHDGCLIHLHAATMLQRHHAVIWKFLSHGFLVYYHIHTANSCAPLHFRNQTVMRRVPLVLSAAPDSGQAHSVLGLKSTPCHAYSATRSYAIESVTHHGRCLAAGQQTPRRGSDACLGHA